MTTKEPHILILPMYYPGKGTSPHLGYLFYEQAMAVSKAGCHTALAFVEQRPLKDLSLKNLRESHFQIAAEENGHFTTLRMHAWNPKLSTIRGGKIWSQLTLRLVGEYIRRYGKPDIIHAHFGLWAGYAASLIRKRYGINYVITEHASSINGGTTTPEQKVILQQAYDNAQQIICVGTLLANNLKKLTSNPDRVRVIPNFVDTSTFALSTRKTEKEREFRFISVGNLIPRKGFAELIQAFAEAFPTQTQISLDIIGEGDIRPELEALIQQHHLHDRVHLLGAKSREEIATLLDQSDAFVLHTFGETFGIVFIEALSCGLPCVGTICGGPEDIITPENGLLHQPGDMEALKTQLRQLYEAYDKYDKHAISTGTRQKYDFSIAGKQLKAVYLQAMNH